MNIIYAGEPIPTNRAHSLYGTTNSIFLAGPTPRDKGVVIRKGVVFK